MSMPCGGDAFESLVLMFQHEDETRPVAVFEIYTEEDGCPGCAKSVENGGKCTAELVL